MERRKEYRLLTDVELELMTALWRLQQATVRDIMRNLQPDRNLAYTSAATIMRILEEKKFVESNRDGRAFYYSPCISKDEYQSRSLRNLSEKLFECMPEIMVTRLIQETELSEEALAEIRSLLDQRFRK